MRASEKCNTLFQKTFKIMLFLLFYLGYLLLRYFLRHFYKQKILQKNKRSVKVSQCRPWAPKEGPISYKNTTIKMRTTAL